MSDNKAIGGKVLAHALYLLSRGLNSLGWRSQSAALWLDLVRLKRFELILRPTDIFIVTYPRSGTTLMQMMLYQLTTDGNMDFQHISQVCPWLERVPRTGMDLETLPSPRIIKSHLPYRSIPKGPCKYIYVVRDGRDTAVSYFHFARSHLGFDGTFAEFFDRFVRGKVLYGSWFHHVEGWLNQRKMTVLVVKYEDLVGEMRRCLEKIIAFCGLQVPENRFPEILERCSFSFMKAHEERLDYGSQLLWERGIQRDGFIRRGAVNTWQESFSSQEQNRFEREVHKNMSPVTIDFLEGASNDET